MDHRDGQTFPSSEHIIAIVSINNNYALYQEAQNNESIRLNYFGIILKVTRHDRGGIGDSLQRQPTFFLHQNVLLLLIS